MNKKSRGANAVKSGNLYEKEVWNIVSNCSYTYNNMKLSFNKQLETDLGGSSAKHDLLCSFFGQDNNVEIEVKRKTTPDWMQCCLYYNESTKRWQPKRTNNKIPNAAIDLYEELLETYQMENNIFNGRILNLKEDRTMERWKEEKKDFKDIYFEIPNDFIAKLYSSKQCKYIQVSEFGLYHVGEEDFCHFNTPRFITPSLGRIRVKYHRVKKDGNLSLSVVISACPNRIVLLKKSNISLDSIIRLPSCLKFESTDVPPQAVETEVPPQAVETEVPPQAVETA